MFWGYSYSAVAFVTFLFQPSLFFAATFQLILENLWHPQIAFFHLSVVVSIGVLPPEHPFITFWGYKSHLSLSADSKLEELTIMNFKHQTWNTSIHYNTCIQDGMARMTNWKFQLKLVSFGLYLWACTINLWDNMPAQSVFKLNFIHLQSMIYAVNCLDCCLVLVIVYAESTVAYGMWCHLFCCTTHHFIIICMLVTIHLMWV